LSEFNWILLFDIRNFQLLPIDKIDKICYVVLANCNCIMGVYSSGMQDALRRLANQKPNLSRLTFSQQKLADSLLQEGIEDGFFVHEGQKHPLPP
jgi:hypothetical protein